MYGLARGGLRRHGRFIGIDYSLDYNRTGLRQRAIHNGPALFRLLNSEAGGATCPGKGCKVDGREIATVFRIPEEYHLLPLNLSERIVLDDHDLDRELVPDRSDKFTHQHAEAA